MSEQTTSQAVALLAEKAKIAAGHAELAHQNKALLARLQLMEAGALSLVAALHIRAEERNDFLEWRLQQQAASRSAVEAAASAVLGPDCKLPKCTKVLNTLWNNTLAQLSAASVADAAAANTNTTSTLHAVITTTGLALNAPPLLPVLASLALGQPAQLSIPSLSAKAAQAVSVVGAVSAALSTPLSLSAVVSDAGQLSALGGAALASLTGSSTTLATATDNALQALFG
ncbi:hypothetical protein WJX81_000037 [Elliptochloris bilobata]|uniref:Uncharacterized protein n=1 Tax=Elliptochloris bilobata TaxID=381761 RepID=A0AAW1QV88_9CHLO